MFGWIGKHWERILLIFVSFLLILCLLFNYSLLRKFNGIRNWEDNFMNIYTYLVIPAVTSIDFTNEDGVVRVKSDFSDLLINSEGSEKKGDGYEINLKIINPTSINLKSSDVIYSWISNNQSFATTITNPNENLFAGSSVTESAFLTPLDGTGLKNVNVEIRYDYMNQR